MILISSWLESHSPLSTAGRATRLSAGQRSFVDVVSFAPRHTLAGLSTGCEAFSRCRSLRDGRGRARGVSAGHSFPGGGGRLLPRGGVCTLTVAQRGVSGLDGAAPRLVLGPDLATHDPRGHRARRLMEFGLAAEFGPLHALVDGQGHLEGLLVLGRLRRRGGGRRSTGAFRDRRSGGDGGSAMGARGALKHDTT